MADDGVLVLLAVDQSARAYGERGLHTDGLVREEREKAGGH